MADHRCVILFVKLPGPGKVKSRLAREMDDALVRRLYECMVLDTIDMLEQANVPFRICFDPPDAQERVQQWLGHAYAYMPQNGEDLGERMERAFISVFSEGVEEALLIGSDIPSLNAAMINEAFQSLSFRDAVIGPANDGGYYLIGFKKSAFAPALFRSMTWSTKMVFRETVARLEKASLAVHRLPELTDIDTLRDVEAFLSHAEHAGHWPARTFSFLDKHRHMLFAGRRPA
jgi:rSAM/selenodomain-associated transferase 1